MRSPVRTVIGRSTGADEAGDAAGALAASAVGWGDAGVGAGLATGEGAGLATGEGAGFGGATTGEGAGLGGATAGDDGFGAAVGDIGFVAGVGERGEAGAGLAAGAGFGATGLGVFVTIAAGLGGAVGVGSTAGREVSGWLATRGSAAVSGACVACTKESETSAGVGSACAGVGCGSSAGAAAAAWPGLRRIMPFGRGAGVGSAPAAATDSVGAGSEGVGGADGLCVLAAAALEYCALRSAIDSRCMGGATSGLGSGGA